MPENVIILGNQIIQQFKSQLTTQQWEMVEKNVENSPMLLQKCRVFN